MSPADPSANHDHPQTIANEPDARGSDKADRRPPQYEPLREKASAIPIRSALGEDAELIRRHAGRPETTGDAVGSGPGIDVGSGTPGDTGELGGGDPPAAADADPLGTYRPGQSRD